MKILVTGGLGLSDRTCASCCLKEEFLRRKYLDFIENLKDQDFTFYKFKIKIMLNENFGGKFAGETKKFHFIFIL